MPNGCDGNVFFREFPEARVLSIGAGGFNNLLHSAGEHIKTDEIRVNQAMYGAIIDIKGRGIAPKNCLQKVGAFPYGLGHMVGI